MSTTTHLSALARSPHALLSTSDAPWGGLVEWVEQVDNLALWLTAVVAGMGAIGWLLKRMRSLYLSAKPWLARAKVVVELAEYELQHNGGGSIKDAVAQLPAIAEDVAALKAGAEVLRLGAIGIAERADGLRATLADHVLQADNIHESQAAQLAELVKDRHALDDMAEALPIVARSTPHECDAPHDEPTGP
jgi:hypothetical protein